MREEHESLEKENYIEELFQLFSSLNYQERETIIQIAKQFSQRKKE